VASDNLTGKVYWANQMGDLPFLGMNSNACQFMSCPVQAGNRQTYEYRLSISKKFPVVSDQPVSSKGESYLLGEITASQDNCLLGCCTV
jgi:hypothetical protein